MLLVPFFRGLARHTLLACLALTAATVPVFAQTNTPSAADGFDPNVDGNVFAMVTQKADGKLIIVGQFGTVQPNGGIGSPRNNIARLNPDGTVDPDFNPNADGAVRAVALQRDGKIVIAGDFGNVGGVARARIARLNANGTVDTTFSPTIIGTPVDSSTNLNPQVFALAIQEDADVTKNNPKLYVGGSFGAIKGTGATAAVTRNNIARLDATGAVEAFDPNANGTVMAIAVQPTDGKVLIGGLFTELQNPEKTSRQYAARINPNGSVDSQFDPKPNNGVTAIKIQLDGKILLGGYFTTVQPLQSDGTREPNPLNRTHLARLNANAYGSVDSEFYPVIGGNVLAVDLSPDGAILVGGHFSQVYGRGNVAASRANLARFALDGTLDEEFFASVNGDVDAFAFQPDGKVIFGGYFTRAAAPGVATPIVRNHIARALPNGALDTAFQLDAGGRILASVLETSDNKIVVAGTFTNIGGISRNYIARLNADGTVDTSYNPNFNAPVYTLAYDASSNKVLAGGAFTAVGGETRNHIVRLNSIGTLDSEFNPNINGGVGKIVLQPDGNILVGGTFSTVQPIGASATSDRTNLLRLTSAGQLDTTFNPSPNSSVAGIVVQSDGKIVIVGSFTALQPGATGDITGRNFIARLNSDGTLDKTYNPNPNAPIGAAALQSDGKIVIVGRFSAFLPNSTTTVIERHFVARVNTDGLIDADFDPHPNNLVLNVAIQPDQKILLGGLFTTLQPAGDTDWTLRKYAARLLTTGKVDTTFNLDLNEQVGSRVDSFTVLGNEDLLVGGTFISLQPINATQRVPRNHFARVTNQAVAAFDPVAVGAGGANVKAIAIQPDGKIVVGGDFSDLGGAASKSLARFTAEGAPDNAFNAALSTNGVVNAIGIRATAGATVATQIGGFGWFETNGALRTSFNPGTASTLKIRGRVMAALLQSDGKLVLGGSFTDLSNQAGPNLIRFNADGSWDSNFAPQVSGTVLGIAQEPSSGKLIVAGTFTSVKGTTRNYIARLDKDTGAPDSFDPNANGVVYAVLVQPDGKIVLGGSFTTLSPNGNTAAQNRHYLARVDSSGNLDTTFDPNLNGTVFALALQTSDNKIIAGGNFTTVQPNNSASSFNRAYLARFNADGSLDQNFDPNPNGTVDAVVYQPATSQIVFGGSFTQVQPDLNGTFQPIVTRNHIARVNSDGAIDPQFDPNVNADVVSIALSPDQQTLLIGGNFTTVQSRGSTTTIARNFVARYKADGTLDTQFNPDVADAVSVVAFGKVGSDVSVLIGGAFTNLQPNGIVLVGGKFTDIGGIVGANANLAELNGDGSVNAAFQPNPNGAINALLPLADGSFLVGGDFTLMGTTAANGVARFTSAATLDTNFNAASTGGVTALAVQPNDGYVIVATRAAGLRRLTTAGATDTTFAPAAAFTGAVGLAVQADGKIVVAGPNGLSDLVARLNADGSFDTSFKSLSSAPAGSIKAIALQTDGSIIVGGSFKNFNGGYNDLLRLKSDGTIDSSFNPNVNDTVSALALQSDGRLVFGGSFTSVGGLQRVGLARIANTAPAPQTIGVSTDGKTLTLIRRASTVAANTSTAGELAGVSFEQSTDRLTWTFAGIGTRIPGSPDWQVKNVTPPADTDSFHIATDTYYIRARAIAPSSAGTSASVYEVVQGVNLSARAVTTAYVVAPVESSVAWDAAHYVWTQDSSGVLRIVDTFTRATLPDNETVLIGGPSTPTTWSSSTRLADLSTLGTVTNATPLISGFAIAGSGTRTVLIRAVGPGLVGFGVTDTLALPQLRVYNNSTGALIASNNGWNNDAALAATFVKTGAFPFVSGSTDAALIVTLAPGAYSAQVVDGAGNASKGGNALVEIYDAGDLSDTSTRVTNLSSRGTVSSRGSLVGGLVVTGAAPRTFLVRGIGPTLARYGVTGVLADPTISVYDTQGHLLATNDNWWSTTTGSVSDAIYSAALASATTAAGAFALDNASTDAALVITLPAGSYSVQVTGVDGAAGAAMIEVYELQ